MPRTTSAETPSTATSKERKGSAKKPAPTHDEIALRAYHIYLERNGAAGNPFDDWKQAEQELSAEAGKAKTRKSKSKVVPFAA
jgi:hypothetical protein